MMRILFVVLSFVMMTTVHAVGPMGKGNMAQPLFAPKEPEHIEVNNRILAKVNGKVLSVIDVMKKLDVIFFRTFPQFAENLEARYQFYMVNWHNIFQELINKELILADAEEMEVEVAQGDVREELELMFGPNLMFNLDRIGLTYKEAWDMVSADVLIRRMMMMRVNVRAMSSVSPLAIRRAFDQYCKDNSRSHEWVYQVLTIRNPDENRGAAMAKVVHELLSTGQCRFTDVEEKLKQMEARDDTTLLNLSEEYRHAADALSPSYRSILEKMPSDSYSEPIAQTSRSHGEVVHRIFYLKEMIEGSAPDFQEVSANLKNHLLNQAIDKETERYLLHLQDHFNIHSNELAEMIPENFQPFSLH